MTPEWDHYFLEICRTIAKNSKCQSRQLGAVIVRDKAIVATGYNGPARGVSHCTDPCPRRANGFKSGEGLHICPAAHAEANCIASAARNGVSTNGCTIYLNWLVPCKDCISLIINAGIIEVVTLTADFYDDLTERIVTESGLKVRTMFTR